MTGTPAETSSPRIGVIGGGQLARMLVEAAATRQIDVVVQSSSRQDPAGQLVEEMVLADPVDAGASRELLDRCDGITFENEWVSIEGLRTHERQGMQFRPSLSSLQPLVNKIHQRELLEELAIPGPAWVRLTSVDPAAPKLPKGWNFPVMAKAASGGYDGKGTRILRSVACLKDLLDSVDAENWLLESWIRFERELALVVSRDATGRVRALPIAETHQCDQVCDWVLAPADVTQIVEATAYNIAASLLTKLDYAGVMAIEMFYGPEGLMVNEIAPRTHNSGHFSIEACHSSQFDQQLCITANLDVPDPALRVPGALMVNLLGLASDRSSPLEHRLTALQEIPNLHLHWYGKTEETPGRKLGHVTVVLEGSDAAIRQSEATRAHNRIREIWPLP